jgi:hypothetical protein
MTTAKATFDVSVQNQSSQPIHVGLAKDGPPLEDDWWSPEEFATFHSKHPDAMWGQTVLPGQTATIPTIEGHFNDGVHGYLRVYAGDCSMSDMLAISRHSPNRLDLPLAEGSNRFVVLNDHDQLSARRLPVPTPPPTK